ncbi:MAG TPA: HAD family hydrolase [Microthrixaceae bacterium]|nr:HAD family hydrolase [Microthrixaceae bacterium]
MGITTIGIDGDDTLWHSENYFMLTTDRLIELLAPWADRLVSTDGSTPLSHLLDIERRNLQFFGYGVKSYTLSMIETAIEVSDGEIGPDSLAQIMAWGRELITHPVELIDGVEDTVEELNHQYNLLLITKGDLIHQEAKIAMSGLDKVFGGLEIVSEKDVVTYQRVLSRNNVHTNEFMMIGNSVPSDVLPVLKLGANAIHIPYEVTWALEVHDPKSEADYTFPTLGSISEVPALLDSMEAD